VAEISGRKVVVIFAILVAAFLTTTLVLYRYYAPERERTKKMTFDGGPLHGVE
jgi:hypothetical protein